MNEVFITSLKYEGYNFNVYLNNGKIEIKSLNDNVPHNIIIKVKKMFFDKETIKKEKCFKVTKKSILSALITQTLCTGILLGTYKNEEINKMLLYNVPKELLTNLEIDTHNIDKSYDLQLYSDFINVIYSNKYLSCADKKEFLKRFDYINKNKDFVNTDELFKTLKNVRIVRHAEQNGNILGDFVLDTYGKPVINLYAGATLETLIHEQYHAIKHNTYYWDDVYYYENKFIGNDEYLKMDSSEKEKCVKYDILGNMIEEAHTSILTAKEDNTVNMNYAYKQEAYLYKIYEKIFGEEKMEHIMLSSCQASEFLNLFLEVGCTKEEAIAIMKRLDFFNTQTSKNSKIDLSNLRYQICSDLIYVYEKKFKNTDDLLLLATIDSISSNINIKNLSLAEKNINNIELLDNIINNDIQILNYIDKDTVDEQYINYGINSLDIDYFSENTPIIYINIDAFSILKFQIDNNVLVLKEIINNNEKSQLYQNMYADYMIYASNNYNDSNYCKYFSLLYANQNIEIEEKIELLDYYNCFFSEDFENEDLMNFLISNKYVKIKKYILNKQNELVQNK